MAKKLSVADIAKQVADRGNEITEREVLLLKRRYNSGEYEGDELDQPIISEDQKIKGVAWLRKTQLKLNGQPRKNCKLGEKEIEVINQDLSDLTFYLEDFYDAGNRYCSSHMPVYNLYSETLQRSFSYYVNLGELHLY